MSTFACSHLDTIIPMDKSISASIQVYTFCSERMETLLDGVDDEIALRRVKEKANPIIWIVGHIAVYRCFLARALGRPVDHGWGDRFDRGVEVDDPRSFPPIQEVLSKCREVQKVLEYRFGELTDEELSAPAPRNLPFSDKTIRGLISFLR